ncbi:penicillin-binding protein 1B [Pseudoalteromonas denitrificans]|uniref:Penicillin-binding protein 1B n=1 Tax=Pseudoalteromonas denitrificans DSM 6059 TaxID=1123010 RepID=A0A1I1LLQ7_9GAMM|nr:penicillin-binding protein 1B [Pseudoalteromonas denitrificans]SFC74137.1 penicillin-binding protein 1B [Pseudoalteromonas denitrificans DSM 6059]
MATKKTPESNSPAKDKISKKTAGKKEPVKKSAAKKVTAKKAVSKKSPTKKKSASKKQSNKANKSLKARIFSWLFSVFWKSTLAFSLCAILYFIYLDSKITRQFEGNKWQLPAQIYARAMTFYPGQYLSSDEVIWELNRLNYSQVNHITNTGQYVIDKNKANQNIRIYRRAFEFYTGPESDSIIELVFGGKRLVAIKDNRGRLLSGEKLEPVQIARLSNATGQDREFVPLERMPDMLKDTLQVVEDKDFYTHHGVSPLSILRALYSNIKAGRTVQGGSTLTQQLAKNFYLSRERTLTRKVNEAFIALILDYRYSKDQILEAYLNEVYLGQAYNQGVHGMGLASEFYFAKPIDELEFDQIALLVGLVKGPSFYNPRRYPERAMKRRDLVLRLMAQSQLISPREYKQALNRPLSIVSLKRSTKVAHPGYLDLVSRHLKTLLPDMDTIDAGVRVFTYFDLQKQTAMEHSVVNSLYYLEKRKTADKLQAAMISVNLQSAGVSALVADRNTAYSGFNRVLDAKRNIGSLVKPAVYLTALSEPEYSLGTLLSDEPITLNDELGRNWQPVNYDRKYRGNMPLYKAFSNSINLPAVHLGLELGVENVAKTLNKLGINQEIQTYPSLLLGAVELSSFQVAQMYTTLALSGHYQKLTTVAAITDSVGNILHQHNAQSKAVFSKESTYLTRYAMKKVTREGTAKRLKSHFPTIQLAGKTGTTNNLRDSWFAGFDQNTATVIWVGRDDNKPTSLTGSSGALELYIRYLKQLNPESIADTRPSSIKWAFVNEETGKQAPPGCGTVVNLPVRVSEFNPKPKCEN